MKSPQNTREKLAGQVNECNRDVSTVTARASGRRLLGGLEWFALEDIHKNEFVRKNIEVAEAATHWSRRLRRYRLELADDGHL